MDGRWGFGSAIDTILQLHRARVMEKTAGMFIMFRKCRRLAHAVSEHIRWTAEGNREGSDDIPVERDESSNAMTSVRGRQRDQIARCANTCRKPPS